MDTSDNPSAPKPNETETLKPIGFMVQNPDIKAKLDKAFLLSGLVANIFIRLAKEEKNNLMVKYGNLDSHSEEGLRNHFATGLVGFPKEVIFNNIATSFFKELANSDVFKKEEQKWLDSRRAPINAAFCAHSNVSAMREYHNPNSYLQTIGLLQAMYTIFDCLPVLAKYFDVKYIPSDEAKEKIAELRNVLLHPIEKDPERSKRPQHSNCLLYDREEGKLFFLTNREASPRVMDVSEAKREPMEDAIKERIPVLLKEVIDLCNKVIVARLDLAVQLANEMVVRYT